MTVKLFNVTPTGTGRKDYSINVDQSVNPSARSHQTRIACRIYVPGLPTIVYPDVYYTYPVFYDKVGRLTETIPGDVETLLFNVRISGDTNAPTIVGIHIFDNLDIVGVGLPFRTFGWKIGQRTINYDFTKGLPLKEYAGKYLIIGVAHYSANPTFDLWLQEMFMQDVSISEKIPMLY